MDYNYLFFFLLFNFLKKIKIKILKSIILLIFSFFFNKFNNYKLFNYFFIEKKKF